MASTARTALGWRNVSDSSDWHHVVQTSFENPRNVSTCVKRLLHDPLAVIFVSNSQDCFNTYLDVFGCTSIWRMENAAFGELANSLGIIWRYIFFFCSRKLAKLFCVFRDSADLCTGSSPAFVGTETLANEMRIIAPLLVVASGLIILVCITSMSRVDKASGEGLAPNVETTAQGETAKTQKN